MMFVSPVVCVILATIHVPLASVPGLITTERVLSTIRMGHATCARLGLHPRGRAARIAVCGLNPHAGEHGLLGSEDDAIIAPAIEASRREGIDASGPYPGDTIFQKAVRQQGREPRFDLVVAMYHDQGLGPLKLVAFDSAVNMTVGLPIVRTSPDHGTAFDIAGRGVADAGSMRSAMEMAVRLAGA
jgi:4-hydroxythreonine-4-phosphate dehydrogenase